jgi:hypothetical protein
MKTKIAIVAAVVLALALTAVELQHRKIIELEAELAAAQQEAASAKQKAAEDDQQIAQRDAVENQRVAQREASVVMGAPGNEMAAPNPVSAEVGVALVEAAKVTLAKIGRLGPTDSLPFDDTTAGALRAWVAQNPQEVNQWLNTIPEDDKQREHTLEALIIIETSTDPKSAFALANGIATDAARANRIVDVARQWAQSDPAAAAQAVQGANLPDDFKNKLLQMLQKSQ